MKLNLSFSFSSKEINKKNSLDPLRTMTKYLEVKKERSGHSKKHGRHKHAKQKHKSIDKVKYFNP